MLAHGAHFSAERPAGWADDEDALDLNVEGSVIRFMWDYAVTVPLWDGGGKLPDEPEWLRAALGLSDQLILDLEAWGNGMRALDADPPLRTEQAYPHQDRLARELVQRLQGELGSRYTVVYRPW